MELGDIEPIPFLQNHSSSGPIVYFYCDPIADSPQPSPLSESNPYIYWV